MSGVGVPNGEVEEKALIIALKRGVGGEVSPRALLLCKQRNSCHYEE